MLIYIILSLFLLITLEFSNYSKSQRKINIDKFLYLFALLVLFLVSAFRDNQVGADTIIYENYFEFICKNNIMTSFKELPFLEPGYVFINKFVSLFFLNNHAITFINSLLVIIFLNILVNKSSKNIILSIFLFVTLAFYQSSFNIVRSCYAAYIGMYAIEIFRTHKVKSILLFILGVFIHKSILILLIVPLFEVIKLNKKNIKLFIVLIIILYAGLESFLPLISKYIPSSYNYYLLKSSEGVFEKIIILTLHISIVLFITHFIKNKKSLLDDNKRIIIYLILEALFYMFSIKYSMFNRVGFLFSMYIIISIPNLLVLIEDNKKRLAISNIVIFICLLSFIVRLNINNIGSTIPYICIL